MEIVINGVNINYIQYGKGKDILLLHGWGQNIEMMKPIGDGLQDNFRITVLDLPGFGKSAEPNTPWTLEEYSGMIEELVKKLSLKDLTLVGHSFGGRIATIFAANNKIDKLVLLSAPMVKKQNENSFKNKTLKFMKKVPLLNKTENFFKNMIGSTDYKDASPIMRQVLVNTVSTDLIAYANRINCPVIFIGGDSDRMVPLWETEKIESAIKDCGMIIYENQSHYAYLQELGRTINIIRSFLTERKR